MWDECFLFPLEKQRKKRKRIEKELRRKPKQNIFQVINLEVFTKHQNWWNQQGSNLRPGDYESPALTD